jgi:hypothetical protein
LNSDARRRTVLSAWHQLGCICTDEASVLAEQTARGCNATWVKYAISLRGTECLRDLREV